MNKACKNRNLNTQVHVQKIGGKGLTKIVKRVSKRYVGCIPALAGLGWLFRSLLPAVDFAVRGVGELEAVDQRRCLEEGDWAHASSWMAARCEAGQVDLRSDGDLGQAGAGRSADQCELRRS
jgi:hypothetical protein